MIKPSCFLGYMQSYKIKRNVTKKKTTASNEGFKGLKTVYALNVLTHLKCYN